MAVGIARADNYEMETVMQALKSAMSLLGLDKENPFRGIAFPGNTVFIKPNWVAHRYRASCGFQHDVYTTITHPAVIRAVAILVDRALDGQGRIIIGDNPSIDADFDKLMAVQGLETLRDQLKTPLEILDLRPLICKDLKYYGSRKHMVEQSGDPRGNAVVDLGSKSLLYGCNPRLFRGVFNERKETILAHTGNTHLYGFSNSIYTSDLFISIPKLKTHHKCGVTLNLKGLVGTVGIKNYLVHWREGFPAFGGDAYPGFAPWLKDIFKRVKKRGAWPGNDTIWRMVVDLYHAIGRGPKRFFSVIDGVLGGEGNGPFCPEPNSSKVIIAGTDFLETDIISSRLMGFNVLQIPYLKYLIEEKGIDPEKINFASDFMDMSGFFDNQKRHLDFLPPSRWQRLHNSQ